MPVITFADFSGGIDRRLPINEQESSKLWTLRNAYVTTGRRIKKRPGLAPVSYALSGSFGLASLGGDLTVFIPETSTFVAPSGVASIKLTDPQGSGTTTMFSIDYASMFGGFPYVVARYSVFSSDPTLMQHHYVDGSLDTRVTDVNCPQGFTGHSFVAQAASRIFAVAGGTAAGVARYSAAGDARDWTTASDAGFLPVGLQQNTADSAAIGIGAFQDALVVFFQDGVQVWTVAVDPTANRIERRLPGVGTNEGLSLGAFSNDLSFLASNGFRSIRASSNTDRLDDHDIGSPIDDLVQADAASVSDPLMHSLIRGYWLNTVGQYWAVFPDGAGSKAWVYSFSRASRIAAWSEYTFPFIITDIAAHLNSVYLRTASSLYRLDKDQYTDDGEPIEVEVQMAFQDAKTPGVDKMWDAADFSLVGSPAVSYLYDPRDETKETSAYTISGDTRPGDLIPVEVVSPSIAPRFIHSANEAFELNACQLYFQNLKA